MKIALLTPFEEPVPPEKYGGTERVVYSLAKGLVNLGHDVTLFASGDSRTAARLVPCVESHLRPFLEKNQRIWMYLQWQGFQRALYHLQTETFDIVHNHGDWPFLIASAYATAPMVTTIHNPVQFGLGVPEIYRQYKYISISDAQRNYMPELNYAATIYHGIDAEDFEFNDQPGDYLAFLGRMHPDKGPEEAIQISRKTGNKLIMAAKIDAPDRHYFRKIIKPQIDGKQIVFIGEVAHAGKVALLKNARALLSPIQWEEPFGLTNIEAMACGTPVIALRRGSLPEIVVDGKTGYICNTLEEMVARVGDIDHISRAACRRHVKKVFSEKRMAENHVRVYQKLIEARTLK